MDRLTTKNGRCEKCFALGGEARSKMRIGGYCDISCMERRIEKLAAYENTGLEPEEIRKVLTDNAKVILESASAEEQNGRLLKENEMLHELLAVAIEVTKILTDNILNADNIAQCKGIHADEVLNHEKT